MVSQDLTAQDIKRIRKKYNLSQQAFARVLGIGEASIVRYENGQKPTRSNANLIRAADNPEFMLDCIERDGDRITFEQSDQAKQVIYYELDFNGREIMNMNEVYSITLQQEILNEQAAEMIGDLMRMRRDAEKRGDEALAAIAEDALRVLCQAKESILDAETESEVAETRGKIECLTQLMNSGKFKAA